ncbi:hypothetical protein P255_00545 [Acinetobacter brisouii CIP 110357]|uniref:Uncharacterized protein n=1 Tax=Acinetobacter brisouii CIP 110357 TaxID=1341683 RepID=V2VXD4_9GAMM|nr:hypothetical protein F954_02385 [Acinetobacter brisouii ANC 4119]ESK52394.1 hypothetical protein P255_00545 [Acinetobacter brisouii CIP 110357]
MIPLYKTPPTNKESQATAEPKATSDQNTQTPETSNTDSTEYVPFTDKSFLENGTDAEQAQELSQEPPLQEEFEVRVRRDESQYSMTGYVDKLNIMSLNNDPTTLTNVSINCGHCRTKGFYDYQNMRYGSVAQVYLGCAAENVREVTITTNRVCPIPIIFSY